MAGPSTAPSHPRERCREGGHTSAAGWEVVRAPQYLVVKDRYYKPFTPGGSAGVDAPAQSPECTSLIPESHRDRRESIECCHFAVTLMSVCCRFDSTFMGLLEVKCLFSE